MNVNTIRRTRKLRREVRQGDDNAAKLLADSSSLVQAQNVNKIRHTRKSRRDVRQGDDNAAKLLADSSSLVQAHTVSDPIFAPVRKIPVEILGKIFVECIPSLVLESPFFFDYGMHPQQVRARLGHVCRLWNTILHNEPGVWAWLLLDHPLPAQEIVTLWIKRSKSHPLDVSLQIKHRNSGDAVVEMLHGELSRIRSFAVDFTNAYDILSLFPPYLSTEAPMMRSLALHCRRTISSLGCIHCPQLRTLSLWNCGGAVGSLSSKPMQNLRALTIITRGDDMPYIKLLQALPNLVSLTWSNSAQSLNNEIPRVALPFLKSLAFRKCHWEMTTHLLRYLDIPSLEHLELGDFKEINDDQGSLNMVLDVICDNGAVQLRRLTLGNGSLRGANFHAMWRHLKYLETLFIRDPRNVSADKLFIVLSPPNHDFSSVCPQLKTLELSNLEISMGALVDFVRQRVKSDLGAPRPGLVTCLKLLNMWVDKEVSAQLAKTHGLSVHLPTR